MNAVIFKTNKRIMRRFVIVQNPDLEDWGHRSTTINVATSATSTAGWVSVNSSIILVDMTV